MEMHELPEDVQRSLSDYRQKVEAAYESEFKLADGKLAAAKNTTRDQLADLSAEAIVTLSEIMRDGENDATRLKAATFVLDKVLGKDAVLDPDDPIKKYIEQLSGSPE